MLERLKKIIEENTGKTNLEITENSVLLSDIGLNSLELVQTICAVEDEFDIEIPDREIKNFKTVGDVIAFLERE